MGATRHISNVREDATTISFDLVVRDEANVLTYGGGRVTLTKPIDPGLRIPVGFSQEELAVEVDKAVEAIIKDGDLAYPKTRPSVGDEPADYVRRLRSVAAGMNLADRPSRRDLFGAR